MTIRTRIEKLEVRTAVQPQTRFLAPDEDERFVFVRFEDPADDRIIRSFQGGKRGEITWLFPVVFNPDDGSVMILQPRNEQEEVHR